MKAIITVVGKDRVGIIAAVSRLASTEFISRGGRVPAPLQSYRN